MISKKIIILLFGIFVIPTAIFITSYMHVESTKHAIDYQNLDITQANVDYIFEQCPFTVQEKPNTDCAIPLNGRVHDGLCFDTRSIDSTFCSSKPSFNVQTMNDCVKLYKLIYQHVSTPDLHLVNYRVFTSDQDPGFLPYLVYERFCQDSLDENSDSEKNRSMIPKTFDVELKKTALFLDVNQSNVDYIFHHCPFIVQHDKNSRCTNPFNGSMYHDICHASRDNFAPFCAPFVQSFYVNTMSDCAELYKLIYQHVSTRFVYDIHHRSFDAHIAQLHLPSMVYDRFCQNYLNPPDSEREQNIIKIRSYLKLNS